jgi:hypothetical protein
MKMDVIKEYSDEMKKNLGELGFETAISLKNEVVIDVFSGGETGLKAYSGKNYDFVIRKGKADIIYGLENEGFLLNKGLCSKLKENNMFVVFSFSSLIKKENIFSIYKNLLINGKLCNDYSINCIYSSLAENQYELLSPFQLESFAAEFGYNYKNMIKSCEELKKRI